MRKPPIPRLKRIIKDHLKRYGVKLVLLKRPFTVTDGSECSGYFDAESKKLVVAKASTPFMLMNVLCHEYGHFIQWLHYTQGRRTKRAKEWKKWQESGQEEGFTLKAFKSTLALERGAELTALTLLKKWGIGTPEEIKVATQIASLYLYSHRLMYEKKRWFKAKTSLDTWLEDPSIVEMLPNTLRGVNFSRIPPHLKKKLLRRF